MWLPGASAVKRFRSISVSPNCYRPFHSTETAKLSVHKDLARSIDRGENSACSSRSQFCLWYCRSQHPSFCPVYSILCPWVLLSIGFCLISLIVIFSPLFAGQQTASATFPVDCSEPQGSVLGPLEFIAYTEEVHHSGIWHRTSPVHILSCLFV